MAALQLRCKTDTGTHRLNTKLFTTSTLSDLQLAIKEAIGVDSNCLKIMTGYPPKPLNLSDSSVSLDELKIRSGDTFTIVNKEKKNKTVEPTVLEPRMLRKEVPADNSCLFYSVFYALQGRLTKNDYPEAKQLRADIANVVRSNPEEYTEAVLGKTADEYSVWIQCDSSWGGGIELSILSKIYQVEIAAVDIQTLRVDNYGQNAGYLTRIFLLYDGIHYDPMYLDSGNPSLPTQTIFTTSDDVALTNAIKVAEGCHKARLYTDTANFNLRCLTCNTLLSGQTGAQKHAKETGHGNFGEVK
ncbi:ubiquitin thioesterase OTU1 [Ciona intestinalis]